jgi:hypothetical protein
VSQEEISVIWLVKRTRRSSRNWPKRKPHPTKQAIRGCHWRRESTGMSLTNTSNATSFIVLTLMIHSDAEMMRLKQQKAAEKEAAKA